LTDLYYVARDHDGGALALACAKLLYDRNASRRYAILLVASLAETGRFEEALPFVGTFYPGSPTEESLYLEVLSGAWAGGSAVSEELIRYWSGRIAQGGLTLAEREEVAYALVELGAHSEALGVLEDLLEEDPLKWVHLFVETSSRASAVKPMLATLKRQMERSDLMVSVRQEILRVLLERDRSQDVLPYLRTFALKGDQEWFFAYQERLVELQLGERLVAFWRDYSKRKDIAPSAKRLLAFQMLEAGHKDEAEELFRELAELEPPAGANVQQLLFLWGPKPEVEQLKWLERRATLETQPEAMLGWIEHLRNLGEYERTVDLVEREGLLRNAPSARLLDVYVGSLIRLERAEDAHRCLVDLVSQTNCADRLERLAKLAVDSGLEGIATAACEKILAQRPSDWRALRRVGRWAFFEGNYTKAWRHFNRCLAVSPNDYEVLFYSGEIARMRGEARAVAFYERSLQAVKTKGNRSIADLIIEAKLWNRLGESSKAAVLFDQLVGQHPGDSFVKADYVDFLIEQRRYDKAEKMLAETEGRTGRQVHHGGP
jgi:tetratricopeptide (TPR) repeat protein